ncbi:hypothetical protein ACLX1H_010683 [Fusarium chlamydosporum]
MDHSQYTGTAAGCPPHANRQASNQLPSSASEPVGDCWYPLEHAEKLTSQGRALHCRIEYLASRLNDIFRSVDKITGIVTDLSQGQHRSTPPAKTKASDNTDDEEIIQLGEPPDPPATDAYRILGDVNSPEHTAMSHIHRVFMHTVGKKFRVELTRQAQRDSVDFQFFILEFLKGEVGGDLTMDVAKLVIATEVSLRFNVITIDTGHFADLY